MESKRSKYILIGLSVFCILLIGITSFKDGFLNPLRSGVGYVLNPIQSGVNRVGTSLYNGISNYSTLHSAMAEKQALQVDVHDLVPDRFVQLVLVPFVDKQARDVDARVVDDAVQTAEMPDRLRNHCIDACTVGHVGRDVERRAVLVFRCFRVHVADRDVRAVRQRSSTIARPMPDAPPVTMKALCSSSSQFCFIIWFLSGG